MSDTLLNQRRRLLCTTAGLTGAALALPLPAKPLAPALDLHDPRAALRAYVKLRGSLADETVFQPYEGDIFYVADGAVPIPLCGFRGLQKSRWRRNLPVHAQPQSALPPSPIHQSCATASSSSPRRTPSRIR